MTERKTDQRAIADKLGLSRSTVTRVLRHDPSHRIAPSTRRLILDTARDMGYVPRRRTTSNIAFVVCGEIASLQHELHLAVCEEAFKHDYRVFLVRLPGKPTYRQLSAFVNPLSADGAIVLGEITEEPLSGLSGIMPVVVVDEQARSSVDNVRADDVELGRLLTQRMLYLGHRDVAVVVQFAWDVAWSGPLAGFRQAMTEAGLEPDLSRVWSKSGRLYPELLREILSSQPAPTAIMALTTSDHAVILSTLLAMGIRVPADLSYVGWAAAYMAALIPLPTVTCLNDLFQSIAAAAVRRLLDRTESPGLPIETLTVPVQLRMGETCARYCWDNSNGRK